MYKRQTEYRDGLQEYNKAKAEAEAEFADAEQEIADARREQMCIRDRCLGAVMQAA